MHITPILIQQQWIVITDFIVASKSLLNKIARNEI